MGGRVSHGMGGCGCVNLDTYIMVSLMPFSGLFACHTLQLKSAVVVPAVRLTAVHFDPHCWLERVVFVKTALEVVVGLSPV